MEPLRATLPEGVEVASLWEVAWWLGVEGHCQDRMPPPLSPSLDASERHLEDVRVSAFDDGVR